MIVVAPNFMCALGGWLAARLCGARAILHLQDLEIEIAVAMKIVSRNKLYSIIFAVEKWILRRFDTVSAISQSMLERLKTKGVDPGRLCLFPNWVDTNKIFRIKNASCFRKTWGIPDNVCVVLYSGSMGKKHGLEIIVEAARLLSEHPGIRFVICGNGIVRDSLEESARGLKNISFYNLQPSEYLNELLNLADIHLLPQNPDMSEFLMPSKLTGIFASGRPVVVTALPAGSLARTVKDCGVVVPPTDAVAFAAAVQRLAKNTEEREHLGEQARAYTLQHWNKEKVLADFEQRLLSEK